jgi:hypothetical protein
MSLANGVEFRESTAEVRASRVACTLSFLKGLIMTNNDSFVSNIYERYAKEYATWLLLMLTDPKGVVENTRQVQAAKRQGEYLLLVFAISVFLGATLGALIPDRPPIGNRLTIFVVVSFLWMFLSFFVHFFCRLLGGKENMLSSLSLMAQVLALCLCDKQFSHPFDIADGNSISSV